MALPDGVRQIMAALLAAGVFLGLYFGVLLEWFVALGLAVATYAGLLLMIPRRRPLSEIVLSDRVSAADIAAATRALTEAARRIGRCAEEAPVEDRPPLSDMVAHLTSLCTQIAEDPADYRAAHRFITSYLPRMVENVEKYVALAARAQGPARDRLSSLRDGILAYGQVVARIDQAGLENDFRALEAEVEALGFQLKRG